MSSTKSAQSARESLSRIKSHAEKALRPLDSTSIQDEVSNANSQGISPGRISIERSQRYLGEVSDVHFFNLVKRLLEPHESLSLEKDFDSYEQDGEELIANTTTRLIELPDISDAKALSEIYFSTIHIAYPFLNESRFTEIFQKLEKSPTDYGGIDHIELALLCNFQPLLKLESIRV